VKEISGEDNEGKILGVLSSNNGDVEKTIENLMVNP
jgi:hypothetical protein